MSVAKSRFLSVCGLAILTIATSGSASAAQQYAIDIVHDPFHPGVRDSWFFDVNNSGQVGGYIIPPAPAPNRRQAVIYQNGAAQVVLPGETATVRAINNQGDAVADTSAGNVVFVSGASGTVTPINIPGIGTTLGAGAFYNKPLNDLGNVLTVRSVDPADAPPNVFSGLGIWNVSGYTALTALDPLYPYVNPPDVNDFNSGPSSFTATVSNTGLNKLNQFAASTYDEGYDPKDPLDPDDDTSTEVYNHAYLYDGHGGYKFLAQRSPTEPIRPIEIDDAGTVLGWTGHDLALWSSTGALLSVLPAPAAGLLEFGYGGGPSVQRNSAGEIVAITQLKDGILLYDPTSNTWTDVTPSIGGLPAGSRFDSIQGFNDHGEFVGLVAPPGLLGTYGFVASPVPEPGTCMLSVIGLAAVGGCRRGRRNRPFPKRRPSAVNT
ncbi:MAG TPA: PEP-CTERM sorting domain-containing protein [Lacipirellulaceae bacterium]|nr:PEP-CTERM sorting domain-containing protein [Lacipirellulaceae bacterium]